ncbi:CvfB family protein [Parafilimonas sp.]|jgi:predicted RNA-binding protein (virulence factor B family)|uniref:CvfB family protein n=1 Tax=Parafilimonas sp. TaxID=1969739 RepID=UPI003F822004
MVQVGMYNTLKVSRKVEFGFYLDDGSDGLLLPKRFAPKGLRIGDEIKVFVYHDSDNRLIATTQKPAGVVGDVVQLKCVDTTAHGAFLDWGLMKDIFVAKSQQLTHMHKGGEYLVKIYIDEQTGRIAATEKVEKQLSNDVLTVKEAEEVNLYVQRESDLGYVMIINGKHIGLLHANEVYRNLEVGDKLKGYIKTIRADNKIDLVLDKPGYERVSQEEEKILSLLKTHKGFLPYHDKSSPEVIYDFFGMSKKTFKMALGALYKQRKIELTEKGIKAVVK